MEDIGLLNIRCNTGVSAARLLQTTGSAHRHVGAQHQSKHTTRPLLTCGEPSAAGGPGYEATRAGTCRAGQQTRTMAD
jgi:hypothetical protein